MSHHTESGLQDKLIAELSAQHCEVRDVSDGCGAKFQCVIVSSQFEGKKLLARHRMVNDVLKNELEEIHAFSMNTYTPDQWEKKKQEGN